MIRANLAWKIDPADVQCCVNIACNPPEGQGICRHANQGCPNGHFNRSVHFAPSKFPYLYLPSSNLVETTVPATMPFNAAFHPTPAQLPMSVQTRNQTPAVSIATVS